MNTKPESNDPQLEQADDNPETIELVESSDLEDSSDLATQLAEAEKRCLIAQADLENYRKRAQRDFQERIKYAPLQLMTEILEISDNLNRAIESAETESGPSSSPTRTSGR